MKKKNEQFAYGGNWTQASSFEIQCSNQYTTETDLWMLILVCSIVIHIFTK